MANKEFVWTDELVREFCELPKLGMTFQKFIEAFKDIKTPKPIFLSVDGVDYFENGLVWILDSGGTPVELTLNGLSGMWKALKIFSTKEAALASRKVLFTTTDGVDVYTRDTVYSKNGGSYFAEQVARHAGNRALRFLLQQ